MYNQQIDPNEEVKLLIALQSGSQDAFGRIYRLYSARIYLNILKMLKSESDAQELLQDVFFKVWTKRDLIDPNQSFRSYLFQIAKYTVYNFIRKKNIDRQVADYVRLQMAASYLHIDEYIDFKETEDWFIEVVDQLPPQRKQIYTLCKVEGKSYAEVSDLLGISTSTVNDHIVKATKFIRANFQSRDTTVFMAIGYLFLV